MALVATLALFAFSPGAVLAAGGVTAATTSNTNCSTNFFEWKISLSGFSAGQTVMVDALFGADELFGTYAVANGTDPNVPAGSLDIVWPGPGGTRTDAINVSVFDHSWNVLATASALPNCTPSAPPPPATPTAKADCDGTGWTAYPAFKNRGQCIAFVKGSK